MGIITEEPRPRIGHSIISSAELVRPQSRPEAISTIASGRQSVALQKRCLVYRSVKAGYKVVNVIPLRSIESFCIRTHQIRSILALALVLLLISVATGFWWYAAPLAKTAFLQNYEMSTNPAELRLTAAFLAASMVLLFIYLLYRKTELVIYTLSGKNSIQLPLSRRIAGSAEAFVAEVEAHIENPSSRAEDRN
ncbi:MAG: hypothetical protein L0387_19585 [Acidobacteria bacterium]|nr:hypothetical protein [Acidobacteriota bacterium]MCI0623828.1 hypothetical protein [Acidobacteriota bacterium]MCI0719604.1 hypothetical protein [Acidobacteriota bacterium]